MENFKGTKGKWHHDSGTASIWHPYAIGHRLSRVDYYGVEMSEEDLANAQLIAHAPEMLEMLDKVNDLLIRRALPTESEVNQFAKDIQDLLTRATTI